MDDYILQSQDDEELPPRPMPLVPPLGFAMVVSGVYRYDLKNASDTSLLTNLRSGHPLEINFPMLEKLKLRTIVYVNFPHICFFIRGS